MSQANVQPISNFAQFNRITTVTGELLDTVFPGSAPYQLVVDGQQVSADPRRKGEPGELSSPASLFQIPIGWRFLIGAATGTYRMLAAHAA